MQRILMLEAIELRVITVIWVTVISSHLSSETSLPCAVLAYHKCQLELVCLKYVCGDFKLVPFILQFTKNMLIMVVELMSSIAINDSTVIAGDHQPIILLLWLLSRIAFVQFWCNSDCLNWTYNYDRIGYKRLIHKYTVKRHLLAFPFLAKKGFYLILREKMVMEYFFILKRRLKPLPLSIRKKDY